MNKLIGKIKHFFEGLAIVGIIIVVIVIFFMAILADLGFRWGPLFS